jgi:hypothetical protein
MIASYLDNDNHIDDNGCVDKKKPRRWWNSPEHGPEE